MSFMFCLRNWIFSSKRPISIIVRSSHQARSNQHVRNEKPVVYNPIIIFSRTSAFSANARKINATLAYLLSSSVVLHPLHFCLWWTRSMAPKPGTCEGCWPVCMWTYVTSEAQAVEHVSTIDRNMFCWSLQTPLSQCAMSGLTESFNQTKADHLHCQHHWPQIRGLPDAHSGQLDFLTFSTWKERLISVGGTKSN